MKNERKDTEHKVREFLGRCAKTYLLAIFMETINNTTLDMPMVALRGLVVFPDNTIHFDVGRKKSVAAVKAAMVSKQNIFLCTQKDMSEETGPIDTLFTIGVVCEIKQLVKLPSSEYVRVVVEGKYRAALLAFANTNPYFIAEVQAVKTKAIKPNQANECEALCRQAKNLFNEYSVVFSKLSNDVIAGVNECHAIGVLADYITSNIPIEYALKQKILEELNPFKRLEKVCVILAKEIQLLDLEEEISDRVQSQIDVNQREYYLHEQMKAISEELNDGNSPSSDAEKYKCKILKLNLDKYSQEKLLSECDRLKYMQISSPESTVSRNYLDKVLELPWNKFTKDNLNVENARKILERDHYGLKEVKERIIEIIAVRKLSPEIKGQIICLVGPPGVGKTSIAKSLAKAINRKYARISLGGVHDEAEIRGHRKTYIGAMPGAVIDAVIKTKSSNPLILLDEIDKLASDYKGDPSSALLEALDPEQNNTFRDHYIEIPFDLSKALFITTANDRSQIPAPLLDRMDIIELYSYTHEEKFNIAKKHLVPKQLKINGIKSMQLKLTDETIHTIIDGYTREAGVRSLERVISKIMRKEAVKIVNDSSIKLKINPSDLEELLGPVKYKNDIISDYNEIGVVNGLAWTSVGGEILKVEAVKMCGTGKLELTGSLGDVMKESAKTAHSYIRSISDELKIDSDFYKNTDIHIHFPEGAVPKDGPSAGIAITTAVVSALTGIPVNSTVAMTGEVTLTGNVLPIGGLKEKTMAAYRSGVKTVIIPEKNLSDLKEIDEVVLNNINFIPVSKVNEVLELSLVKEDFSQEKIDNININVEVKHPNTVWQQN